MIPLIFHNRSPKVPPIFPNGILRVPQLLMAGTLGIEGRKLKVMISDEKFPTSFPTKGTSQKEILYNKRKQLKLEGSFNSFFILRFCCAWQLGFLALSCCKWWSAARYSLPLCRVSGWQRLKENNQVLVGTGEIFKKARNSLKFGHFGGSNYAAKLWGFWGIFPYLIKP